MRRLCHSGLNSTQLREAVGRRVQSALHADAFTFASTDPDTGMLNHAVSEGVPGSIFEAWIQHLYPYRVAAEVIEMATRGPRVTTRCSSMVREVLEPVGLGHDLRGVLSAGEGPVGFFCLLRDRSDSGFTEADAGFLSDLVPHLTRGLSTAAILDRVPEAGDEPENPSEEMATPGMVVLDLAGKVRSRTAIARTYMEDLGDLGHGAVALPCAVASVAGRVVSLHQSERADERAVLESAIPARGRSGRWYSVRASLAEPDEGGVSEIIVLIQPAGPRVMAPLLSRLYGLSPREREALALVAKGFSTKAIARRLEISPYTVQEHIGNACTKVGVRTRRELLARVFLDGYAPALLRAEGPAGGASSGTVTP